MKSGARLAVATLSIALATASACGGGEGGASAFVVTNRTQLIGGDRSLGDVGDYLLQNDKVRIVIQKPGFSRGFGVYGGSLIDADLRRPNEQGTSGEPIGNDQFGELFPDFFVQAVNVQSVFVSADGTDGGPAKIVAQGEAGDLLELAALLNRAVTGSNVDFQSLTSQAQIRYTTTYELRPHQSWITIHFKVQNVSSNALKFPSALATQLLGLVNLQTDNFTVPVGDIALFGATSNVFIPGIGFDSRFGLQESYAKKIDFPAFPGVIAEWVASRGKNASYGLAVAESDRNFVFNKKAAYDDGTAPITKSSLLVPFSASSFLGIFHDSAPAELKAGDSFEVEKYFVIGNGDVGSVLDGINQIRGIPTGRIGGRVFDRPSGLPSAGTSVLVYQRKGSSRRIFDQFDVRPDGSFGGTLPEGEYSLRTQGEARPLGALQDFTIAANESVSVQLENDAPARIVVRVQDEGGSPLPAKVSAVGIYGPEGSTQLTRHFLFDLQAGERFRASDLVDDDPSDPETRKFIEQTAFTDRGTAELIVKPGTYRIVASRGPEYDLQSVEVTVGPNETRSITERLERVVDTAGFVAGDLHIHSRNSIDSSLTLDERVRSLAGEGVEWAVATDHNFVTDYQPYVARNDLIQWLYPMVGLEMTTLESGHFNGYPLRYDPGPVTRGSFAWAERPPGDIFDDLRALGSLGKDRTIVQVNHPRDGVLGYFSQYQRSSYTFDENPPTLVQQVIAPKGPAFRTSDGKSAFSGNFDAMEIANGKLFYEIHHYRVPDILPKGDLPANVPAAGHIVVGANGLPGFPGVVEDWFNTLNLGRKYIAVGTGDSHSTIDEAGHFRTMVFTGDDRPSALDEGHVVDSFRAGRVVATNGPLVDFFVDDQDRGAMGKTIQTSTGKVHLVYRLAAAPWLGVSRLNIWRNGVIAKVISIEKTRDLTHAGLVDSVDLDLAKDATNKPIDSWFTVEAIGYDSFFPVVTPHEIPPVLLTEAVAVLAGPLGLGNDEFGALRPPDVFPVTAYAMTNPVWVTTHAGAFEPPGLVPLDVLDRPENDPKMQVFAYPTSTVTASSTRRSRAESRGTDRYEPRGRVPLFYPRTDNPLDVRKVLSRFGHLAGHGE